MTLHLECLAAARARMDRAKQRFTEAAQASQRGNPDAPALVSAALAELNAAREDLRRLAERAPGAWRLAALAHVDEAGRQ